MTLRIRSIREDKDLMQKNLANYLGCTQQTYSRYETGELEPSLVIMEKLAIFYETSIDYLMGLTDDSTQKWSKEAMEKADFDELAKKRDEEFSAPKVKRGRRPKNPIA